MNIISELFCPFLAVTELVYHKTNFRKGNAEKSFNFVQIFSITFIFIVISA